MASLESVLTPLLMCITPLPFGAWTLDICSLWMRLLAVFCMWNCRKPSGGMSSAMNTKSYLAEELRPGIASTDCGRGTSWACTALPVDLQETPLMDQPHKLCHLTSVMKKVNNAFINVCCKPCLKLIALLVAFYNTQKMSTVSQFIHMCFLTKDK